MGAKLERVAGMGDRDCAGRWRQWALLDSLVVKDDLINLLEFESGDLDRRAGQDQLLELDLELIEVPLPFSPGRLTARRNRRCSSSVRWSTRKQGA